MENSYKIWNPDSAVCGSWNGNLFTVEEMICSVRKWAQTMNASNTLRALEFAVEKHDGQYRKNNRVGEVPIPYIIHPLMMVQHAWALGWQDDSLTAAILLHDVCEDCNVLPKELPVAPDIQHSVGILTKTDEVHYHRSDQAEQEYYRRIREDRMALIVKILDRCHNVSGMAAGFSGDKLKDYIERTERDFYPLLEDAEQYYPEDTSRWFLLRYHMYSVVESLRTMMDTMSSN